LTVPVAPLPRTAWQRCDSGAPAFRIQHAFA
jgi:hypothetical protein